MNQTADHSSLPGALPPAAPRGASLIRRLRNYFLAGVVVTGPIGITVWLAVQLIDFFDLMVARAVPAAYAPISRMPFSVPGVGLVVVVVALTLVGFLTANLLGRTFLGLGERLVQRMPVVRSVYSALKQIFETVLSQTATAYREVVLIEYPRRGLWTIGFVTGPTRGEIRQRTQGDLINVFVPTTPNPTSGFLLFVPRADVVTLRMSVEDALKTVISGGLVVPAESTPGARPPPVALPPTGTAGPG